MTDSDYNDPYQEWYIHFWKCLKQGLPEVSTETFEKAQQELSIYIRDQSRRVGWHHHQSDTNAGLPSHAWIRFVKHCLNSKQPYANFHALVNLIVHAAKIDLARRELAVKRGGGIPHMPYDENADPENSPGVISFIPPAGATFQEVIPETSEALACLVARNLLSIEDAKIFIEHYINDVPMEQLQSLYNAKRATLYRRLKKTATLLRSILQQ